MSGIGLQKQPSFSHKKEETNVPPRRTASSNMLTRPPAFSSGVSYMDDPKMKHLHGLCAPREKGLKEKRRIIDFSCCKYEIVRMAANAEGWAENTTEEDDWDLFWIDTSVSPERVMKMKWYQKINHFPGMSAICRKVPLGRNLNRMKKLFPKKYNFYPPTWVLPQDFPKFKACKQSEGLTYIIKPNAGCQGRGIILTKDKAEVGKYGDAVVQVYLDNPFLIDGFKFDLRVYVLILCLDPLRIYMFKDGLVRLCTSPYRVPTHKNVKDSCMHLTNYALNKQNDKFEYSDDFSKGSKRDFAFLNKYFSSQGVEPGLVWDRIAGVLLKTIISVQPQLIKEYKECMSADRGAFSCFELLGFDIMLDDKLHPWLIEVNHSPSFNIDTLLDKTVKMKLLRETLQLACVDPKLRWYAEKNRKQRFQERMKGKPTAEITVSEIKPPSKEEEMEIFLENEKKYLKNYILIYPTKYSNKFDPLFIPLRNDVISTSSAKVPSHYIVSKMDRAKQLLALNQEKTTSSNLEKAKERREIMKLKEKERMIKIQATRKAQKQQLQQVQSPMLVKEDEQPQNEQENETGEEQEEQEEDEQEIKFQSKIQKILVEEGTSTSAYSNNPNSPQQPKIITKPRVISNYPHPRTNLKSAGTTTSPLNIDEKPLKPPKDDSDEEMKIVPSKPKKQEIDLAISAENMKIDDVETLQKFVENDEEQEDIVDIHDENDDDEMENAEGDDEEDRMKFLPEEAELLGVEHEKMEIENENANENSNENIIEQAKKIAESFDL